MDDERVIKLLEEIRDIQKQNVANYQTALRNQEEAIRIQRTATRRVLRLAIGVIIVLFLLALLVVAPYLLR